MDSLAGYPPAKRRCTSKNMDKIELRQHIRQFQLPQQFPSTLKQAMREGVTHLTGPLTSTLAISKDVESTTERQIPYKLQKLRILSPNGKDLGEFNVKLQTDNPLKGETVTITKPDNFVPIKQLENVSLSTASLISNRIFPRILKQGTVKISRNNLMDTLSSKSTKISKVSVSQQQHSITLSTNGISMNDQDVETNKEKQTYNNIIDKESFSTNRINFKHSVYRTIDKNNQKLKIYRRKSNVEMDLYNKKITVIEDNKSEKKLISPNRINPEHSVHLAVNTNHQKVRVYRRNSNVSTYNKLNKKEITIEDHKVSSDMEVAPCTEIDKSPIHILNIKKLINVNSNANSNIHISGKYFKVSKGKCIATIKNTENGLIVTSLKNAINCKQKSNQIDRNLNQNVLDNNSEKNLDDQQILDDKSGLFQTKSDFISKVHETETQRGMTIIPNNNTFKQNTVLTQDYNIAVSSTGNKNMVNVGYSKGVAQNEKCDNMQNKYVSKKKSGDDCPFVMLDSHIQCKAKLKPITNTIDANVESNVQNEDCPGDLSQKDLLERWNIIKKAMNSIKDNELREQALKALEDCGIGTKKHVPICPPEQRKAVHDTQVQTMVFSLLDPKSFILINKDLDSIHRIKETALYDLFNDEDVLPTNNLQSNNTVFKTSNTIEEEENFDIDSLVTQVLEDNSNAFVDVLKIKDTFSPMKIKCKSLIEHLEKDFESVKRYDQYGMLNIHNAVLNNNIYLVRRQLMVLEQCKESVDILTENGETSLELAIKYDINDKIVKLLLEAGAQPATSRCVHDSALIIASRQSSPLLPMLIDRVSDSKLLDQMDSEGLTALHYCSIRGNMQGVKALLSAGATIDLRDMKSGRTPLFHALDNTHTSIAHVLIKTGAVANIANYAGQTPLPIVTETKSSPFRISVTRNTT